MDNRKFLVSAAVGAPLAPSSPSSGYPSDGIPATVPGAFWFHAIGEELRNVITAAGLTPTLGTLTQLKAAMDVLYAPGTSSLIANGTITLAGGFVVKWGQGTDNGGVGGGGVVNAFPVAFPTSCFGVVANHVTTGGSGGLVEAVNIRDVSASSYTGHNTNGSTVAHFYIAFGH